MRLVAKGNGTRAAERAIHEAQAAAEGVHITRTVEFRGRKFRLGPCEAITPMLDFARAAAKGLDTDDPAGIAAMYDMIEGAFILTYSCGTCETCQDERYEECPQRDPGDWPAFWRLARATGATGDELMEIVQAGVEQATARPTPAPSGSSSPGRVTSVNSKGSSSSRVPEAFAKLPPGDLIDIPALR